MDNVFFKKNSSLIIVPQMAVTLDKEDTRKKKSGNIAIATSPPVILDNVNYCKLSLFNSGMQELNRRTICPFVLLTTPRSTGTKR
ncbi:MAG TPA: hypothetical protein GX401_03110 [Clostridiales bacterium]|nr:hypothetical protein [Clostridiales bacterium]